jgi:hypothetical protein
LCAGDEDLGSAVAAGVGDYLEGPRLEKYKVIASLEQIWLFA